MNRLFILSFLLFMYSSIALSQTTVLSGNWGASSETRSYTLNQNTGDRTITIEINFLKPFKAKPNVVVGISSIDVDKGTAVKYSVKAISVSRDGFTVEMKTWGDTKIYSVTGFWVAHTE